METTFTQADLLRYLYEETTPAESTAIEDALKSDARLASEYRSLLALTDCMDRHKLAPGRQVLHQVLNHIRPRN